MRATKKGTNAILIGALFADATQMNKISKNLNRNVYHPSIYDNLVY